MKNIKKNNLILIFFFFNSIIIAQKTNVIDSLSFSNNAGRKYILYVKEKNVSTNRIVEIYSVEKNKKNLLIAQNKKLIPCEECGGMRGDRYISVGKDKNYGFTIYLDNNEINFKPMKDNFILKSSQFIQVIDTEIKKSNEKIKTKKITYTPKKIISFNNYSIEILEKKCFKKIL